MASRKKHREKEKNRKDKPLGKKAILAAIRNHFAENPFGSYNYKQVSHVIGVYDKSSRKLVNEILEELATNGELERLGRGKFKVNPVKLSEEKGFKPFITGKVDMKQTGKAYVITPELGEDIYISPNNTGHALHGDTVKVRLFPKRKGHKPEGEIVEVLQRAKTHFVGTLEKTGKFAFMISESPTMPYDIFIPPQYLNNAKHGQKVVVKMTDWPEHANNPFGEVVKVLGTPGDNEVEMQAILVENDFPLAFPKEVEAEAARIPVTIPQEEIQKRRDFRQITTFTIDPIDAKDFDDAISYRKLENGLHEVGIHIADVSYYVHPGSMIDREAYNRGTSVYLVDRTIPMLPEKLSNMVCSLRPHEDKLCFSAVFEMDDEARVVSEWFGKTIINSDRRFDYDEVQTILETGQGDLAEELKILWGLASKLRENRFKKGSISFRTQEVKFKLDEKGKPLEIFIKEQKESNFLIEDFMLLANRRVAERIGRKRGNTEPKTFVYRIHDQPSPEKLSQFIQFVGKLGYKMRVGTEKSLAKSFNELFDKVQGKGEENLVETLAIRTMAKAEYSTRNIGHYGLAFPYYTHFTSPIRRYPDLMVHRLLQRYLEKKPSVSAEEYEPKCVHSSEMERKAQEAERASIKFKQAEYMADKIGKEFDGLISGVSKYGIFVEIKDNKCEGMIRLQDLDDDFYYLDEENYRVIGHRYQREYKLGDPIRIRVKSIDIRKKQIDFERVS